MLSVKGQVAFSYAPNLNRAVTYRNLVLECVLCVHKYTSSQHLPLSFVPTLRFSAIASKLFNAK